MVGPIAQTVQPILLVPMVYKMEQKPASIVADLIVLPARLVMTVCRMERKPVSIVVAGYQPVMPEGYDQTLSEQDVADIVEYLNSLG